MRRSQDHSTFSKNRHGRFKQSGIYQVMFDEIVQQCIDKGLLSGKHLTVDSTLVKANASFKTMEPIVVTLKPEEYIEKVEEENSMVEEQNDNDNDESWDPIQRRLSANRREGQQQNSSLFFVSSH